MMIKNADKQVKGIDAFIKLENVRFRVRACGIIIKDGRVLMIKNNYDDYYYSVGGAIHLNESTEDACLREVFEETGYHYEIDRLIFIHENFFKIEADTWHEIAFYYLMKENNYRVFKPTQGDGKMIEEKVWIPICDFDKFKAYPQFFKHYLNNLPETITHIKTYE